MNTIDIAYTALLGLIIIFSLGIAIMIDDSKDIKQSQQAVYCENL